MDQDERNPYDSPTFGNSLLLRVDGAIGAMSLSPSGRDAVLAGRQGLFVIDLDDPFTTPRWLHHITSWEVADVQWSPHHFAKPSWCISTSNQKALLWDLERISNNAIINVLHEHTRAITDINFHPFDPEILATCSIDTFIYSWDMRTPRKPVAKWAEWRAGATQVKWNHDNQYEIASSHDHSFYIWDTRKGALPVLKVNRAHDGKINGLDFSNGSTSIITCSNDKKVKFWNLKTDVAQSKIDTFNYYNLNDNDDCILNPSVIINTDYPVARARAVPFGKDKACGIMALGGGDNSIRIVNYDTAFELASVENRTQVIGVDDSYTFKGQDGQMKDFLWRTKHEYYQGFELKNNWKDYQLVSWSSEDYDLKLWQFDEELYKTVNYDPTFVDVFKEGGYEKCANPQEKLKYNYKTYCLEPPVTIEDLSRNTNGDVLSSLALLRIAEKRKSNLHNINQLNHLDWIAGVRLGRTSLTQQRKDSHFENVDEPSNLGEEVSVVGHKFPKVRFERISVSTGELVISLKGLVDYVPNAASSNNPTTTMSANTSVAVVHSAVSELDEQLSIGGTEVDSEKESVALPPVSSTKPNTSNPNGIVNIHSSQAINSNVTGTASTNTTSMGISSSTNANNSSNGKIEKENESTSTTTQETQTPEQIMLFIRIQVNFPSNYPYLTEIDSSNLPTKKLVKLQKSNQVRFDIEETYELTPAIKLEMLTKLNEIAHFYTNKYQRFCLEPCLRFLMGEKIELDDSLMIDSQTGNSQPLDTVLEIGSEGWADEFILQQPEKSHFSVDHNSSGEEDNEGDLIPTMVEDESHGNSQDNLNRLTSNRASENQEIEPKATFFDSTPIPKGCGGIWSANGQLVCFFVSNNLENHDSTKESQKINIINSAEPDGQQNSDNNTDDDAEYDLESKLSNNSDDSDSASSSDNESFSQDWDEMLRNDAPERARIPGLFKTSVGLGNRFVGENSNKNSLNRFSSQGGTGSNYKSSLPEVSKKKKNRSNTKHKNIVKIFDFTDLLPDKYDLACEYRILGDDPEILARHNGAVALKYGLNEISEIWKILELILIKDVVLQDVLDEPTNFEKAMELHNYMAHSKLIAPDNIMRRTRRFFWGNHPFGHSWVINEIFKYFEKKRDCQMLAMLACILHENSKNLRRNADNFDVPIHTPYKALPPLPSVNTMSKFNESRQSVSFSQGLYNAYNKNFILSAPKLSPNNIDSRNSSILNPTRDQHIRAGSFAESVSSSLGSIKSPDRFGNIKKNIQPFPSNSPYNGMTESTHYLKSKLTMLRLNVTDTKKNIRRKPKQPGKSKCKAAPFISIEMHNVDLLDLYEDVYTLRLLDSQDPAKLRMYREQYASMLYLWELPINRIKILKFNYADCDNSGESSEFTMHSCRIALRNRARQNPRHPFVNTISTMESCKLNSWNTNKRIAFKYCNLCQTRVVKNFIVCQTCEHILHTSCSAEWWGDSDNEECPSGCGCRCLNQ